MGAEILSTFDAPERKDKVLGTCSLIEEVIVGEDKMINFGGCQKVNKKIRKNKLKKIK
jgi:T-complex protein 1 subunit beta